jgi:hypothetical protein
MVENMTNAANEYKQNVTTLNSINIDGADIKCSGSFITQTASAEVQADQQISVSTSQEFENIIKNAVEGEVDQEAKQQTTTAGGATQTSQNSITNETNFLNEIENVQSEYYRAVNKLANRIEGSLRVENFLQLEGVKIDPCDNAGYERLIALEGLSDDIKRELIKEKSKREAGSATERSCLECPDMTQNAKIELIIEQGLTSVLDTFSTTTADMEGIVKVKQKSESENKDLNIDLFGDLGLFLIIGLVVVGGGFAMKHMKGKGNGNGNGNGNGKK